MQPKPKGLFFQTTEAFLAAYWHASHASVL
jgi:hypothetical protein